MSGQMTAMIQQGGESPKLVKDFLPKPKLEPHQLLVKISHAAQNPTDIQTLDGNVFGDGTVLGCDFVGEVEDIGSDVSRVKKGDVIAGLIWGGEIKGLGAYSEYTVADERICFKIPGSVSRAEAATVPLASGTALLGLFSKDCLAIDKKSGDNTTVLVWGGSSSVGLYAIQIANIHGLNIIATCSPRNFDLVKGTGAHHIFDYSDPDVAEKIKAVEPNLKYIFDTIGNDKSSNLASQAVTESGGTLCTVRPGKANTEGVTKQTKVTDVLIWTVFLKEHKYGTFYWPPNKDDHELAAEFFDNMPKYLDEGKIKPNKLSLKKGLDAVPEGFQEYRDGNVSGYKIVYEF